MKEYHLDDNYYNLKKEKRIGGRKEVWIKKGKEIRQTKEKWYNPKTPFPFLLTLMWEKNSIHSWQIWNDNPKKNNEVTTN